ncbi:MAG: RNA polymerase II mediator complex subunit [Sclerophora amabilis]|nr:MAG: RNA polymerase II mediator complex subunit [Sclerophora amabilis]
MTSRPAVGNQRPHQRNFNGGLSRPPAGASQPPHGRSSTLPRRIDPPIDLTNVRSRSSSALMSSSTLVDSPVDIDAPARRKGGRRSELQIFNGMENTRHRSDSARRKPKATFEDPSEFTRPANIRSPGGGKDEISTTDEDSMAPGTAPPMPKRFGQRRPLAIPTRPRSPASSHPPRDTVVKPYVLDAPSFAPLLSPQNNADFFPWTGQHPEDVLSEHAIKHGYFDKTQTPQNEYQSARPSIWPALKQKTGLQTLSSLFVSVLEQRQSQGRITAPSTFKPPPRVTLTDTKREAWLRDLANSAVPLRRLSRTIPHGIRGKILLEQCLSKNIPTGRAVWLAKCVGANELRAVKRKGANATFAMGNEVKWIRDWTVFVEQFMESIVGSVGSAEWKAKMIYAARFAAHLYSENLLDQEHYLRWVLASFKRADLNTLPVWVVNLRIYWKPLARNRKYGRELTESLLEKIKLASAPENGDTLTQLVSVLWDLTTTLTAASPENFVNPQFWAKYGSILRSKAAESAPSIANALKTIEERNLKLTSKTMQRNPSSIRVRRILRLLDDSASHTGPGELSTKIFEINRQEHFIIHMLLRWVSSPYREGLRRVYTTVRLIRRWKRLGAFDTDETILSCLSTDAFTACNRENLYLLISELIRSNDFSVGRYLQWLIARGALNKPHSLERDPCEIRLLSQLPLSGVSEHVINLRRMLLSSIGVSVDQEDLQASQMKSQISKLAPELFSPGEMQETNSEMCLDFQPENLSRLSRTVKCDLSRWIRRQVGQHVTKGERIGPTNWRDLTIESGVSAITVAQFNLVRASLEQMQDFSILADVLKLVSNSANPLVLSSGADTLSYHFEVFSAIGALEEGFKGIFDRYQALEIRRPMDRCLLSSLKELAVRIPKARGTLQHLNRKLSQCDQKSTLVVSSPVSDHTTDILQTADADFGDEIEKLLSSGTSIDKPTLKRYFDMVTMRIQSSWGSSVSHSLGYSISLSRLRSFDEKSFDGFLRDWIGQVLRMEKRPPLGQIWTPLVVAECLNIATILSCLTVKPDAGSQVDDGPISASAASETLHFLVQRENNLLNTLDYDSYRFRLKQERFAKNCGLGILSIARMAIDNIDSSTPEDLVPLLTETSLSSVLKDLLLHRTQEVYRTLLGPESKLSHSSLVHWKNIINKLLETSDDSGMNSHYFSVNRTYIITGNLEADVGVQVTTLVEKSDEMSLPFYQTKLLLMLKLEESSKATTDDTSKGSLATTLLDAVQNTRNRDDSVSNSVWIELVADLDEKIARRLCAQAEGRFLGMLKSAKPLHSSDPPPLESLQSSESALGKYLTIIEIVTGRFSHAVASNAPSLLLDGLDALVQLLNPHDTRTGETADRSGAQKRSRIFSFWVTIVLRILVIHEPGYKNANGAPSSHETRILTCLCTILLHQEYSQICSFLPDQLKNYVFDVTAWLADATAATATATAGGGRGRGRGEGGSNSAARPPPPSSTTSLSNFPIRHWEILSEPTPLMGENDTSLSLTLFGAYKASYV